MLWHSAEPGLKCSCAKWPKREKGDLLVELDSSVERVLIKEFVMVSLRQTYQRYATLRAAVPFRQELDNAKSAIATSGKY